MVLLLAVELFFLDIHTCRMSHKILSRGSSCVSWRCWTRISERKVRVQLVVFLLLIAVEWNVPKQDAEGLNNKIIWVVSTLPAPRIQNQIYPLIWCNISVQHKLKWFGLTSISLGSFVMILSLFLCFEQKREIESWFLHFRFGEVSFGVKLDTSIGFILVLVAIRCVQ